MKPSANDQVSPARIKTEFWAKPIPLRQYDWLAWDDNTYCCPECHSPVGHGATEQEAIADLKEQLDGESENVS